MGFGAPSAPKPPPLPAPTPIPETIDVDYAKQAERLRLRRAKGRASTILTEGLEFVEPSIYRPRLKGTTGE